MIIQITSRSLLITAGWSGKKYTSWYIFMIHQWYASWITVKGERYTLKVLNLASGKVQLSTFIFIVYICDTLKNTRYDWITVLIRSVTCFWPHPGSYLIIYWEFACWKHQATLKLFVAMNNLIFIYLFSYLVIYLFIFNQAAITF